MDGRPRHALAAGRIGLLVVALGTAWGAVSAGGSGHGPGAVLVAAPAVAATNPHPAVPPASTRSVAPRRISRDEVRAASRLPRSARTPARRHAAR
jgi:hypothetical protein